ncbi:MAG: ATP-dependent Clp protease ATP-binding subunit ClpX, partial [Thermoguttaceae bacterium]
DSDAMVRVLREPKNALVKQYRALFAMEGSELEFTEKALDAIAQRALEKETGARALRSIIEEVMLDILFELPEQEDGTKFRITDDMVMGRQELFPLPQPKPKSA